MEIPPPYTLRRTSRLRSDEVVVLPDSRTRFYVRHKSWTTGPTHSLLDGPTEAGPRLAAWKHHSFGCDEVCLGDFETADAAWVPLEAGGVLSRGRCSFRAPDSGRVFLLEKSHDARFGLSRVMKRGFLLRDAGDGRVVAVFRVLGFHREDRARFEWMAPVTWAEQILCLMAMVGTFEKLKDQSDSSTGTAAGGAAAAASTC